MSTSRAERCHHAMEEPAISSRGTLASDRMFFAVAALIFGASAITTVLGCSAMSAMGEMPMPGSWTMSMAWMRMPGQSWPETAMAFLGMWMVMMAAMMLPSLVPLLWRYRQAWVGTSRKRMDGLTARVGLAYFLVWSVFGTLLFPLGAAFAAFAMEHPAVARVMPIATGAVVLIAGALQFTRWKTGHLAGCREVPVRDCLPAKPTAAWRYGLRLGMHCGCSSAGLTAILLVTGVMDLFAMAVVTAAITVERLAPDGQHAAQGIGVLVIGAGVFLLGRAMGLALT